MKRLEGKAALITGGASGIGEATARLFCAQGARCVIADIQEARGHALAEELGAGAVFLRTDVSSEDDVAAAVDLATDLFGRLDCMFNNAGFMGTMGPIDAIPVDEVDTTLQVLLRGPFLGMKHAARVMKGQGSGCIITTSSIAGVMGGIGPHIYAAAKAATIHLTRSVALELAEYGIRVNAICPGVILTPLATASMKPPGMADDEFEAVARANLKTYQPIRRAGEPSDIAACALWLASEDAAFVTGQAIVVDGGVTAGLQWPLQPDFLKVHVPMKKAAASDRSGSSPASTTTGDQA